MDFPLYIHNLLDLQICYKEINEDKNFSSMNKVSEQLLEKQLCKYE